MKNRTKQWLLKTTTVAILAIFSIQSQAMSMKEVFDAVNAQGNVTSPAVLQGQTMNLGTGGSLYMRMPKRTYNLVSVTPPSLSAGCGGIDLFMGGFSFINKDQFVAMMRNIGSNALGYAFELALSNISPDAKNIIQALRATANAANKANIDSCAAAQGLVNATMDVVNNRETENTSKMLGVDANIYTDVTDAWTKVANNWGKREEATAAGIAKDPKNAALVASGNVVWKSLKKIGTLSDQQRAVIMSMVGTYVVDLTSTDGSKTSYSAPLNIGIKDLIQGSSIGPGAGFDVYQCADGWGEDECKVLTKVSSLSTPGYEDIGTMTNKKLIDIANKISARGSVNDDEVANLSQFLNMTDLPVYKAIAVSARLGNAEAGKQHINKYKNLIAVRYAEVYVQVSLRALTDGFKSMNDGTSQTDAENMKKIQDTATRLLKEAREIASSSYTDAVNAFSMAQEIQHYERAVNQNLSVALKNSLAFYGK